MITAMLLAHVLGDYILQPDSLARWKAQAQRGVLVHGLVVLLATWLLSLPFDRQWWPWAVGIGLLHTGVDSGKLWLAQHRPGPQTGLVALRHFAADQAVHLSAILLVLFASGYLPLHNPAGAILSDLHQTRWLSLLMGYLFLFKPAWIITGFVAHGITTNTAPNFSQRGGLYTGFLERLGIITCILLGQFLLLPIIPLARIGVERHRQTPRPGHLYTAELAASFLLAITTGLGLRWLMLIT